MTEFLNRLLHYRIPTIPYECNNKLLLKLLSDPMSDFGDIILHIQSYNYTAIFASVCNCNYVLQKTIPSACPADIVSPMNVVGPFLDQLFSATTVQALLLPQRYPPFKLPQSDASTLHMCFDFTQTQIIRQLFSIYQGLPEAFEILHCTSRTTEQDIHLFTKRVLNSHSARKYVVLDLDNLPFHLQEVTIQCTCMQCMFIVSKMHVCAYTYIPQL